MLCVTLLDCVLSRNDLTSRLTIISMIILVVLLITVRDFLHTAGFEKCIDRRKKTKTTVCRSEMRKIFGGKVNRILNE